MKVVKTILNHLEGISLVLSPREKKKNHVLKQKQVELEEQIFIVKKLHKGKENQT